MAESEDRVTLERIVGVGGTNGAGKDSLAEVLSKKAGYKSTSVSDSLRAELRLQGKEPTRRNMSALSQSIRQVEGEGALVNRILQDLKSDEKICITSIRTPGEVEAIQQAGGAIIWIDADPEVRYQRISTGSRGRQATDGVSYDEFLQQEAAEMTPSEQGGGLNMSAVRDMANYFIKNNFSDVKELASYINSQFDLGR